MPNPTRQPLLVGVLGCLLMAAAAPAQPSNTASNASLRSAYGSAFLVGVAMDGWLPKDYQSFELDLVRRQFGAVTPANCMKMPHVQRAEGRFDFRMADALVAFAATNQLQVCGHCLVWAKDERTPGWFFRQGDQPAGRELLLQRMKAHIQAVAGHYRGKVISWDVVNEALDDGTNFLRPSKYVTQLGEDFIAKAFEFAHEADPGAVLIYNDYNVEQPAKREKLLRLLQDLIRRKTPIHAVGIQGHYELDQVPYQDIEETIVAIHKLGLKVLVSELDIDVIPRSRWWAEDGKYREEMARLNPYTNGCPPQLLQRQAEQYGKLFQIFRRHAEAIDRITFWDLHDGRSWLNSFPWHRVNYPLLFDRQAQPKPAFWEVIGQSKPVSAHPTGSK